MPSQADFGEASGSLVKVETQTGIGNKVQTAEFKAIVLRMLKRRRLTTENSIAIPMKTSCSRQNTSTVTCDRNIQAPWAYSALLPPTG
jgi:hypothetical protein